LKKFFSFRIFTIPIGLVVCSVLFLSGVYVGKFQVFPYRQIGFLSNQARAIFSSTGRMAAGRWHKIRTGSETGRRSKDNLAKYSSLPYLSGYNPAPSKSGVTFYDKERAQAGLTLYCSGHDTKIFLVDMAGSIVYEWGISFEKAWPDPLPFRVDREHKEFIRRAHLYPNGDLITIFEYVGLVKLDKDSNPVWKYPGQNHHDLAVAGNGDIYSLASKTLTLKDIREQYPGSHYRGDIVDDRVVVLTHDGKELRTVSLLTAFYRSGYASLLDFTATAGDIFHANSIDIVSQPVADRLSTICREGDVMISIRNLNTIAIIDASSGVVKWALSGMWRHQHKANFLDNGNILLFDNQGANSDSFFSYDRSRVIEFDPYTQKIAWEYTGNEDDVLFTYLLGYDQRLPNGNTLITEDEQGRIIEVSPDKSTVWEYFSPFRAGKRNELIATIMSAIRIDAGTLQFLSK
jgi:hypothetical protein